MTTELTLPTIHRNGTSREELYSQLERAHTSLCQALMALHNAVPNPRDYYTQATGSFTRAVEEHQARVNSLVDVDNQIVRIAEHVQDAI